MIISGILKRRNQRERNRIQMKTAKLIIGIISIVLSVIILFMSFGASIFDAVEDKGGTSGGAGVVVAILMLIAGIVSIAARSSRGGGIFVMILYAVAGLLAVNSQGVYKDLVVWGGLCFVFAVIFLLATFTHNKRIKKNDLLS